MEVKQGREEDKQKGVLPCKSPCGQPRLNPLGEILETVKNLQLELSGDLGYSSVTDRGLTGDSVHENGRTKGL